jgi:hypothetical protein
MRQDPHYLRIVRFTHVSVGFLNIDFRDEYFEPTPRAVRGDIRTR